MRRQRLLGKGQIAVCMRSGIKCKASELVRDGRIPSLLVLPEWADPAHPQERPYVPDDNEGYPKFALSPDITPVTNPVLSAEVGAISGDPVVILTWTAADREAGPRIEQYDLYRDGERLTTVELEYSALGAILGPALEFEDDTVEMGVTYSYSVVALTSHQLGLTSNTATVTIGPITSPVLAGSFDTDHINLSWTALDGATAQSYTLFRTENGGPASAIYTGLALAFEDDGVTSGVDYGYTVEATVVTLSYDSNTVDVSVTAPSAPVLSGNVVEFVGQMSWTTPSAGSFPIAGYRLYNAADDSLIVDQVGTTYNTSFLNPATSPAYYVVAYDTRNTSSARSNTVTLSVPSSGTITQTFASVGTSTYTKYPFLDHVVVSIWGGGGGGAGGGGGPNTVRKGGGAGGGGYVTFTLAAASVGATETVTVGQGGAGGASVTATTGGVGGNGGSSGGTSSFGSWGSATGGTGGFPYSGSGANASAGGTGSAAGGTTGVTTESGGRGWKESANLPDSRTSAGAGGGQPDSQAGGTSTNGGAGGSGGVGVQNGNAVAGSPGASRGGGGGGGGAAGTNGPGYLSGAGGAGGRGEVVVVSHISA